MKFFLFSLFAFAANIAQAQFSTEMKIEYAQSVGDSFEIYISKQASSSGKLNVVYYCDANLKSGRKLRELLNSGAYNNQLQHTMFVGIGHIGNYHVLRRRDFILPSIKGKDTIASGKDYGQTAKFYAFLKTELVPSINKKFNTDAAKNSILGHSLGGLFAFYCLFKNEDLFANYYALSPALWIDGYSIYKFNLINGGFRNKKFLYFASGSKETLNRILKGANEAKEFLDQKKYQNLRYEYKILPGKTHNSEVPESLDYILKSLEMRD